MAMSKATYKKERLKPMAVILNSMINYKIDFISSLITNDRILTK
jgi:hypothetical protein